MKQKKDIAEEILQMRIDGLKAEVEFWKEQFDRLVDILCESPDTTKDDLDMVIDNILHKDNLS